MINATPDQPAPRYNVAPRTYVWVARTLRDGRRELTPLLWGLLPYWADDPKKAVRPINARAETVASRPMFRNLIAMRRCLIPVDGFYEWQMTPSGKVPHYVRLADGAPMLLGGLWDRWQHGDAQPIESFTILTTRPNELIAKLHERMPLVVDFADAAAWLSPTPDATAVSEFLRPYPAERMAAYPVSRQVNSVANEGPALIDPA